MLQLLSIRLGTLPLPRLRRLKPEGRLDDRVVANVGVLGLDLVHGRVAVDGLVLARAALVLGDVGEALASACAFPRQ